MASRSGPRARPALFAVALLFTASGVPTLASAKAVKVDVCHARGDGSYNLLSISESALSAHLGHGDVLPGAWYPDSDGDGFGDPDATASEYPEAGYVDNADDCGDGGAASGPGMAELADGYDNDCDGWTDEDFFCPCYDMESLDELLAGLDTYAYSWAVRYDGFTQVTSLRGQEWSYSYEDVQWQAPTVGADLYRVAAEDDAPYCETWSQTWLAAPDHSWADDGVTSYLAIPEESFDVCQGILDDWMVEQGTPLYSW